MTETGTPRADGTPSVGAPEPPLVAVVDTNVLIDVYSCHDLTSTYEQVGVEALDSSSAIYRRARARESLLLVIYLHRVRARTYSLHSEPLDVLTTNVDPQDDATFETHFTKMVVNFVLPVVLPGWDAVRPDTPTRETGNAADAALIAYAKKSGLPLITNEGFTSTGYFEGKIARRARAEGVAVFFPHQFYAQKIDEAAEIEDFVRRFVTNAPAFTDARQRPELVRATLDHMEGYFRHVLLGIGPNGSRVRVSVV
jgi:hypothetical protein